MQEQLAPPSVGGRVGQGRPGRWVDAVPALGPHLEIVVLCQLLVATPKGEAYLCIKAASDSALSSASWVPGVRCASRLLARAGEDRDRGSRDRWPQFRLTAKPGLLFLVWTNRS